MKIVATFSPPSSVKCSLKCRLTNDIEHLVVAKLSRLEVYSLQPEGLVQECGLEIWGNILSVRAIQISGTRRSNLLVLTDHPDPELFFLNYKRSASGIAELTTTKRLSLYERSPRPAEYLNDVVMDESGDYAIVSCYASKLKCLVFKNGGYGQDFDLSLAKEINILSLAFLCDTSETDPVLSILHIDHQERLQLLARGLVFERDKSNVMIDISLSMAPSVLLPVTTLPQKSFPLTSADVYLPNLVPIPPSPDSPGGVAVIGGRTIMLYEIAPPEKQRKWRGKQRRLERKKSAEDKTEVNKAREKEKEREGRQKKARASVEWPWSEVTAWCQADSLKFLLCDAFGRLAILSFEALETHGIVVLPLGETSSATTLTYLTSQVIYVGSHFGDSLLLRINSAPESELELPTLPIPFDVNTSEPSRLHASLKGKSRDIDDPELIAKGCIIRSQGNFLRVLQTFKNIAPVADAILVDTDGSVQPPILTCSGGQNTGSINMIRKGGDFQESAVIDGIRNVTNIWPIRALFDDPTDTHILVSTLHDTQLFRFENLSTISRIESLANGFTTHLPTLAATNVSKRIPKKADQSSTYGNSSFVVQVTSKGVCLLEFDIGLGEYTRVGELWTPEKQGYGWQGRDIVAASVNASQFVLALSGARVVILNLRGGDEFQVAVFQDIGDSINNSTEISAVSCIPIDPSKKYCKTVLVSFWGSNRIDVYKIEKAVLMLLCKTPSLPALPRSLLLHNFGSDMQPSGLDYQPYLLAGLADGNAVSFVFNDDGKSLSEQKNMNLGNTPVVFTTCEVDGRRTVFACGSRAAILFRDKERLKHSPVLLKDVVTASWLNTPDFKSSVILASTSALVIGKVKDLDRMHIRSVTLGAAIPRKIIHQQALRVFGVACVQQKPVRVGDPEESTGSFRLLDDTTFQDLARWDCDAGEEITSVQIVTTDINGSSTTFFCVGTVYHNTEDHEPNEGRLLVFTAEGQAPISPVLRLVLVASEIVQGCVYALTIVKGVIAAAINASVVLFSLEPTDTGSTKLHKLVQWTHNYIVSSLVSRGDRLMLGDAISSVSILELQGTQLRTVARDYGPLWPVCVQALDEKSLIGADADCNIFTFTLQPSDRQTILERIGSYHMGDMVSKFMPGTLVVTDASGSMSLSPKQLFFTSSGRVGVVIDVGDELSLHLTALERNMASVITGTGGVNHTRYRAPKNSRGCSDAEQSSFGFIDGDFIEGFLGLASSSDLRQQIQNGQNDAERLTLSSAHIQRVLEALQNMH